MEELGEGTVRFMRTIKKAVDPLGLFNPGKVSGFQRPFEKNTFHNDKPYFILVLSRPPRVKINEEIMLLHRCTYCLFHWNPVWTCHSTFIANLSDSTILEYSCQ